MKSHFIINFGPQHPAAHGVLRLLLEISGEKIRFVDPHIGFLHRGTEKLIESKTILQSIPYFDRLDYVSTLAQEHSFVLTIESLLNIPVSKTCVYVRTLLDEVTRVLNHLMCITTHALDVGAITPFLWGFEEREKLLSIYELITGARMHTAYYRIGGFNSNITNSSLNKLSNFITYFLSYLDSLEDFLSKNSIWKSRLINVGLLNKRSALSWSCTGPVLRSCGIPWDLRKTKPYAAYNYINFNVVTSNYSDCLSRYHIRLHEMRESCLIISDCCISLLSLLHNNTSFNSFLDYTPLNSNLKLKLSNKLIKSYNSYLFGKDLSNFKSSKNKTKLLMEELIFHYKYYSEGFAITEGLSYSSVEAPKGEVGVLAFSLGLNKLIRCKIRSPDFFHLQVLNYISKGYLLADVVTNIGSLDIVFGSIDR